MKRLLACDVDLCVVDPIPLWEYWFLERSGVEFPYEYHDHYFNLEDTMSKYMDEDPLDFWRMTDLYDFMDPRPGAVNTLELLSEYMDIIFVTDSFDEHKESKERFLFNNFPFTKDVIHCPSANKHEILADFWIEDRVDIIHNLTKSIPSSNIIMMTNKINNDYFVPGVKRSCSWLINYIHLYSKVGLL